MPEKDVPPVPAAPQAPAPDPEPEVIDEVEEVAADEYVGVDPQYARPRN